MNSGRVVILNGAPRSGKSSIAAAIQQGVPGTWLNLGVDWMMPALQPAMQPGIGLRPGGERPDLEPIVGRLYAALFDSIAAHARQGFDVVSDLGIHDGYSRSLGIRDDAARRLADLTILFVGVRCPLEVIMERRNREPDGPYLRGPVPPEPVLLWQDAVHTGAGYDLEVDTSATDPHEAAEIIGRMLRPPPAPSALTRSARG